MCRQQWQQRLHAVEQGKGGKPSTEQRQGRAPVGGSATHQLRRGIGSRHRLAVQTAARQNRPMNTAYLPSCCSPLNDHWPLPHTLPSVQLISTRFSPELLDEEDFSRCAIEPVRGVAKRQTEYLAGRLCAREALIRLTGISATPACGEDRA